jgi:hypothetical protein
MAFQSLNSLGSLAQLVNRGVGPLGGHYAAIVKQGLTEAPFSEEGLKELILKVDPEIVVPEKVRGDKANINSDTLMRPMARQSLQSIPEIY